MAGHSKWANIRFRKAAQDKKRGKIFTKLNRELMCAARIGGADEASNPRLRKAVKDARKANMTVKTIQAAIDRGAGDAGSDDLFEIRYEGFGPAGVAIMVDCISDNRNRTVAEVRHAFTKMGGNLGKEGSVAHLFIKQGQLTFSSDVDDEQLMEYALEAGAEDMLSHSDGSMDVITTPEQFSDVRDALESKGLMPESADITMQPLNEVALTKEHAEKLLRLIDKLEECEDVQDVYSNADISDEVLRELDEC